MAVTNKIFLRRFLIMVMVSIIVLVPPLSFAALQQDRSETSVNEETSFELGHARQAQWGMQQAFSPQRLLPVPHVQLLFIILSLITVLGVARVLLFLYPAVFLLRKIELLLPIKFTSIYVGLTSKS